MFQFTRPVGGATWDWNQFRHSSRFQFTRPVGGATLSFRPTDCDIWFQFTRPVGGATLNSLRGPVHVKVSIHAPRGGRDEAVMGDIEGVNIVSIHAPRGGRDPRS